MADTKKVKIAFFDFADCEGCQLQLTYLNERLVGLLGHVEIVNFREAISERSDDYAVAVVEGTVTRHHDEERLKAIRERAAVLVAYGACACIGGVNGLRLRYSGDEAKAIVYPDRPYPLEAGEPRPLDKVVKVDACIHGCPVHPDEVVAALTGILIGKGYKPPRHAVCVECKLKENVCMFEKDQVCLGPVTRAGCGAWCTSNGNTCYGCRGMLEDPNVQGSMDVLQKHGYTLASLKQKFTLYNACALSGDKEWKASI